MNYTTPDIEVIAVKNNLVASASGQGGVGRDDEEMEG